MTLAYFDCFSGASGDMILGSLIDAGAGLASIDRKLAALAVEGCSLSASKVHKQGLAATQVTVTGESKGGSPHRSLASIRSIIEQADLVARVKNRALAAFERLAQAEAQAHGCALEQVHFHELGAVDTIADVVGAMLALDELGIDRVVCSPVAVGSGTVECAHGILPVPAPATLNLLIGVPLAECDVAGELTTPTGAAILTSVAEGFGPLPSMTVERVGYGAGTRDLPDRPNLLRVILGQAVSPGEADEIVVLEANLDDTTPEVVGHCLELLLEAGALDAYCVPIYMKKSRPAFTLTVLAEPRKVAALEGIVFAETSTLGVRHHQARRSKLAREIERVETPFGPIAVKIGRRESVVVTVAPEYEDCRAAARRHGVPLREVMESASQAWRRGSGDT
jgi:uncharacterized protein (TIGR00299 family) protein